MLLSAASPQIIALLTLGTPHRAPPLVANSGLARLYDTLGDQLIDKCDSSGEMGHAGVRNSTQHGGSEDDYVPIISLSGGMRDTLVRQDLSLLHFPDAYDPRPCRVGEAMRRKPRRYLYAG